MESRLEKGPVCGVENCRSRWYEEGEDGYRYCQNGHQQFGLIRAADDDDDFTLATTTRTRKKKDTDDQVKIAKRKARRSGYLVKEQGLPEELELMTLDLWALRIAQLGDRISNDNRADSQSHSQVFSTLETDDSEIDDTRGTLRTSKGQNRRLNDIPNLLDCLSLCYLAIQTLRLPITPGDIYSWATEGKLAYRGAIKHVPLPMRDRLPPSYHATLNPNALLNYKRFYATVTDLQIGFTNDYKVAWAPLNYRLLVFRYMKELALPLEVYDITIRLGKVLDYDFVLQEDGKRRLGVRHLPEAQLASCLVVCVKLLYPFDGVKRHPRSAAEPTAAVINWAHWKEQMELANAERASGDNRFTIEELTKLEERDVFDMAPDRLDQYLDFYADTFLDDAEIQRTRDTDNFRNAIFDMFPVRKESVAALEQNPEALSTGDNIMTIRAVHSSMQPRSAIADDEVGPGVVRPGQSYQPYKKESDLPAHARMFYEAVAKLAGLSMDMLMMAVFYTEARIEKWRRRQKDMDRQTITDEQTV
ncbi:hypothetical protein OPT61_g7901 [Boeremia exigua]|uniref:Uncharacterized protein n=1 Tax=Boeremia exigua TaxID=749465 RepID=A0ACC2I1D0_9PLEO|nr:hypothetical protein OPT61_g7901 [Boeremia exigua]